jgi:endonuclease YncB( thermonuclease family)
MKPYRLACITAALCIVMLGAGAQLKWRETIATGGSISGPAVVIDGDTVIVNGIHVRLKGVDAAERGTSLGEAARQVMIRIVGGRGLTCELTGEKTWNREVGFCFTADGTDINKEIIAQGAALSYPRYSNRYIAFEQASAVAVQARAHYCLGRSR